MLVPTSRSLLLSKDQKDDSFNTIKVDFSKMSFISSTKDNFTQCSHCKSLLTIQDKKHILLEDKDEEGRFIWVCRFCRKENFDAQIYFVSSNFKYIIEKNISTKIVPPIVLFLVDVSGSMMASVSTNIWDKKQTKNKPQSVLSAHIRKVLSQSVMRKNQSQYLMQLQNKFGTVPTKQDNLQHFSKLSLLFAIIQYHLKTLKQKKHAHQFRVGFIFFNDTLMVLKGAKQKSIPIYVHQNDNFQANYPFKQQKIDFNSYQQLYQKGKSYDKFFGDSKLDNFDIKKVALQHIQTGGKTALGPALSLASGIISQHDQGSKIILVTDSLPNYGLLSQKSSTHHYKQIQKTIQQTKSTLAIFRLFNQFENTQRDVFFQKFINQNQQHVKKIQVALSPNLTEDVLDSTIKSLRNLINHQSVGSSYKLMIFNDNQNLQLNKFKYDNVDYRDLRFITSHSQHWIQVNLNKQKICQKDLLFPCMTQLVLQYSDTFSKQHCLFMSYIIQRIINPSQLSFLTQQEQQQYQSLSPVNQFNTQNLQSLVDLRNMAQYQQSKTEIVKKTYRSQMQNIIFFIRDVKLQSIQCRNTNDYVKLQNFVMAEQHDRNQRVQLKQQSNHIKQPKSQVQYLSKDQYQQQENDYQHL